MSAPYLSPFPSLVLPSYDEVVPPTYERVDHATLTSPVCEQPPRTFITPIRHKWITSADKELIPITARSVPRAKWTNGQCRTWLVEALVEFCYIERQVARYLVDRYWKREVKEGGKDLFRASVKVNELFDAFGYKNGSAIETIIRQHGISRGEIEP